MTGSARRLQKRETEPLHGTKAHGGNATAKRISGNAQTSGLGEVQMAVVRARPAPEASVVGRFFIRRPVDAP